MAYDSDKPCLDHWSDMDSNKIFVEEFQKSYRNANIQDIDHNPEYHATNGDSYNGIQLVLPPDTNDPEFASITKMAKNSKGVPIEKTNENSMLDT